MKTATKIGWSVLALAVWLPSCTLIGVEPDEIDLAVETGEADGVDDPTTDGQGDGDGDGTEGPEGDGDGDPTTGDGDGDSGDGDGDGGNDVVPCADLVSGALSEGDNLVEVLDGPSLLEADCGSPGPEAVFEFTAVADGVYEFTFTSDDFDGVIYLAGPSCEPLEELVCTEEGQTLENLLPADNTIYVVVDSDGGFGSATVTIAMQ